MSTQAPINIMISPITTVQVDQLMSEKGNSSTCSDSNRKDANFYVHPHLVQSYDPEKGRRLQVSAPIPAGTVLVTDPPYAIVPVRQPTYKDGIICSNMMCCQLVAPDAEKFQCLRRCIEDVIYCSESCRVANQSRHESECPWLKQEAVTVRTEEDEADFYVLWLVLRLIAAHNLEIRGLPKPRQENPIEERFKRGWDSIAACRDNIQLWPQAKLQHWKALAERYLSDQSLVPGLPSLEETAKLICQVETNFFHLHPRAAATDPFPHPPVERGELYGMAIYPVATIGNHSCNPNVRRSPQLTYREVVNGATQITHKPDSHGRMVFTTVRELVAGEECCYTYFDLSEHVDLKARRAETVRDYCFSCTCERCTLEEI